MYLSRYNVLYQRHSSVKRTDTADNLASCRKWKNSAEVLINSQLSMRYSIYSIPFYATEVHKRGIYGFVSRNIQGLARFLTSVKGRFIQKLISSLIRVIYQVSPYNGVHE